MKRINHESSVGRCFFWVLTCLLLSLGAAVCAQGADDAESDDGVHVSDSIGAESELAPNATSAGPVRMVRFTLVQGDVTWRADSSLEWSQAAINLPLRQGAQVFVPTHGRAELQFDDGSLVRLGAGALMTFQNLYSDADGEFTELKLNDGLVSLHLKNKLSIYQVDTPHASVKAVGPARFRVGVRDTVELAVKSGSATVEGQQGKTNVNAGEFLEMRDATSPFAIAALPTDDNWEQWNDERDRIYEEGSPVSQQHLPPNLSLVAPDLDSYGTWQTVPTYGAVWCPRVSSDWRPYSLGHWVWVNPFGWTWVSNEAWGWAPYHYGTWAHTAFGWAWVPGPSHQYWSPAVVNFCSTVDAITWTPLCPEEVRYPVRLRVRFRHGDWSTLFSIGGCGVYYPGVNHVCEARPWNTVYINHGHSYGRDQRMPGAWDRQNHAVVFPTNHNRWENAGWVPRNARHGGATIVNSDRFATGGSFAPVLGNRLAVFRNGHFVTAPIAGHRPVMGPAVRPTPAALTPTHSFAGMAPPSSVVARRLYHAPIQSQTMPNLPTVTDRPSARTDVRSGGRDAWTRNNGAQPVVRTPANFGNRPAREDRILSLPPSTRTPQGAPGTGIREPGNVPQPQGGSVSARNLPVPPARTNPMDDAVIRARASMGLPARVRHSGGTFDGSTPRSMENGGARNREGYSSAPRVNLGYPEQQRNTNRADVTVPPSNRSGGTIGGGMQGRQYDRTPDRNAASPRDDGFRSYRQERPSYGRGNTPVPQPAPRFESRSESRPAPQPAPRFEPRSAPRFEPRPAPQPAPRFEPRPAPRVEPRPAPQPAPRPTPPPSRPSGNANNGSRNQGSDSGRRNHP